MNELLIFVSSFALMELVSYLAHRYIYHGIGWKLHKSHHEPRKGMFEWNDIFPMTFAAITMILLLYALAEPGRSELAAAGFGVMAYGLVYFFVHDLYIHRRARWLKLRIPFLQRLKQAHAIHHRYGGEPYGLLIVISPERLRAHSVEDDESL
jgi:beta-carotene 3-hydroxylase